jgi:tetratricopeptide (TPR) repeat protein
MVHPMSGAESIRTPGRLAVWCGIAVAAGILAAYSNHFQNGFHFDDSHTIVNNAFIADIRYIPRYFWDATTFSALPSNQSYRPIVSASLAIDYNLGGGLKPFWFQLSDFIWFLLQTALLGLLILRVLETRRSDPANAYIAALAAGLFGLHPANADTVNYIIARSDIISTLSVLGGFALYLTAPRLRKWQIPLLPVAAGMLAKPITAMYAPLLALYLLLFPGRNRRFLNDLAAIIPAFLVCGAMSLFVLKMTPKTWVAGAANAHQYLVTQPYVALLYFKTFFWPAGLSADYDLEPFVNADDGRLWAGVAFAQILLAGGIVAAAFRRTRVIGFGLLWFIIALLPTSLSPLAEVMNDHRTFFPYMGLVIALAGAAALLVDWMPAGKRFVAFAAMLLLCVSGYATYERNKVWRDDESLWHDVVLKSPGNGRALMNYGTSLMANGRLADALADFQRAEAMTPYYPIVYVNLAIAEAAMGSHAQAERDFQTALRLGPQIPDCHTWYANWLLERGRPAEAESQVRAALALAPGDLTAQHLLAEAKDAPPRGTPESYLELSLIQFREARYAESISSAQQSLKLRPDYAEAFNNIGAAWNALGRYDLAAAACEQALRLKPAFPLARNNLIYALQMGRAQKKN